LRGFPRGRFKRLPEGSQKAPRRFPEGSQKAPRRLPEGSQKAPKRLPEAPRRLSKDSHKAPRSSLKAPGRIPERLAEGSPKVPIRLPGQDLAQKGRFPMVPEEKFNSRPKGLEMAEICFQKAPRPGFGPKGPFPNGPRREIQ